MSCVNLQTVSSSASSSAWSFALIPLMRGDRSLHTNRNALPQYQIGSAALQQAKNSVHRVLAANVAIYKHNIRHWLHVWLTSSGYLSNTFDIDANDPLGTFASLGQEQRPASWKRAKLDLQCWQGGYYCRLSQKNRMLPINLAQLEGRARPKAGSPAFDHVGIAVVLDKPLASRSKSPCMEWA